MNEQFPNQMNSDDEKIAQKLSQVAEQTQANRQFAADLEEKLRSTHKPVRSGLVFGLSQISPAIRWAALLILLAVALSWSIRTLIPAPQPASNATPVAPIIETPTPAPAVLPDEKSTPSTEDRGYDWRGTKLYLSASLPQSPADAKIYVAKDELPATTTIVNQLGAQYGIQGNVYELPGSTVDALAFLLTDGKQRLYVQSDLSYDYYADYGAYTYMSGSQVVTVEQASIAIDAFLKAHGLDVAYQVETSNLNPGMFYVLPLTPDGLTLRHDHNMPARLEITIDANNQVLRLTSYQTLFNPIEGNYGIRTAEEAFQQVLSQSNVIQNGVLEIMRSSGQSEAAFWSRTYPDNQTLTLYGVPAFYPAIQPNTTPFV